MDFAFYLIVLALLVVEWLLAKNQNRALNTPQILSNVLCTVLIVAAEPLTERAYFPLLEWTMANSWQLANSWSSWLVQGLFALLILDLTVYCLHRCQHLVPVLWWIHEPHHQATEMNLSVGFRQSFFSFLIIWIAVVPLLLIGFSQEIILATLFFHRLYDALMHSNRSFGFGKLEWILVSPRLHRVHHGLNSKYINKNFANVFICFDRLFGTFQMPEEKDIEIGLPYKNGPILNPITASIEPLLNLLMIRKIKRLFTFSND